MSRIYDLFFYADHDPKDGRVRGNFVIRPEGMAGAYRAVTSVRRMSLDTELFAEDRPLTPLAGFALWRMPANGVTRMVVDGIEHRFYTLRDRAPGSRWAIVYSDLPDNETDFRVLDLATGEESALYPLDQCQQIVLNAQQGKLLGSFGAG